LSADVDVPDKVLEKRIHLAEVSEEEEQGISVAGFLGIKSRSSKSKTARRSGRRRTAGCWSAAGAACCECCWYWYFLSIKGKSKS
jgi:hypothetical protein